MKTIDNKFEIGEECYTYARENIEIICPVCKGAKRIFYNNYEIPCKQCNALGKIIGKQTVVAPRKVRIRRIVASIWNDVVTIKYKVDSVGEYINIRNRGESSLFKTLEECEQKCKEINQGECNAVF
nr:MAG TPA: TRAP Tryptophan RNA-binding attenuator protein inhibitory protein [Caudoviricetes sp.]